MADIILIIQVPDEWADETHETGFSVEGFEAFSEQLTSICDGVVDGPYRTEASSVPRDLRAQS